MTGATSQMACMVTALFWIYMLPYMSVMSRTPKTALAAVITSAVVKNIVLPKKLLALRGSDLFVGLVTAITTVITNPTIGFVVGCAVYTVVSSTIGSPKTKVA